MKAAVGQLVDLRVDGLPARQLSTSIRVSEDGKETRGRSGETRLGSRGSRVLGDEVRAIATSNEGGWGSMRTATRPPAGEAVTRREASCSTARLAAASGQPSTPSAALIRGRPAATTSSPPTPLSVAAETARRFRSKNYGGYPFISFFFL